MKFCLSIVRFWRRLKSTKDKLILKVVISEACLPDNDDDVKSLEALMTLIGGAWTSALASLSFNTDESERPRKLHLQIASISPETTAIESRIEDNEQSMI